MANPNLKVVRRRLTGAVGAPSDMEAGQIAINAVDEKVYIHTGSAAIPVAGKGEFVDRGSEQSVTGKKNFTAVTVSTTPADANDAVRKTDLDTEVAALQGAITTEATAREQADDELGARIDALGSAFNYIGTINGGASSGAATNLASLTQKDAGDYYKVGTAGHFVLAPATSFFANANDGIVFNLAGGVDLIDNTNSNVSGTANEIAVTGSSDTGFTVSIDPVFSGRVTSLETATNNLGTMADQDADSVAITGGTIDGTTIGGTTAAAGSFTSLTASSMTVSGDVSFNGNIVGDGSTEIQNCIIDAGTF